jgi:2-polyprenyl-3-methyl-5-hydroxy-6-metoxy-1,4-benzoquinol methylase
MPHTAPRGLSEIRGPARYYARSAGDVAVSGRRQLTVASPSSSGKIALCDDVRVTDEVLADQVDYYRRRAGEYDVTAYGDVAAARARIARLVAEMRPAGSVLEIACGTGLWTEALAGWADTVTAIDAAPEAVAIARDRVRPATVSFEVADVFSWDPGTRFDVIFFSAWLSHVPASRFGRFWQLLGSLLAGNGRVLFIDEHVDERGKEAYVTGRDEVVERQLRDGSTFRVVKNFVDPAELEPRLRRLGWECAIRRDGTDWVYGEARLAR